MNKLFSSPYEVKSHFGSGVHRLYKFPNGYGASVVRFKIGDMYGSYTDNENEWELAVIKWEDKGFNLTYDTSITDDVLGHLTEDQVEKTLNKISKL